MKLAVVYCLHGDEKYGMEVIKMLPSTISFFIGNRMALKENKRFIDADLNRCFPGKTRGNYEERAAYNLVKKLRDFDYVIDLHSSSNNCPLFGIITKPSKEKIEFARKLGLKRLVIIPKHFASGKALIDFVKCGISLEIGPHDIKENITEVAELINNLIGNKDNYENMEIFEVKSIIKKEAENVLIENFKSVKKGQTIADGGKEQKADTDFIPVLVNERAYHDILSFACKKTDIAKFYKHPSNRNCMNLQKIPEENAELVERFGAVLMSNLKEMPDFYTFNKGLIYSHRDFDKFFSALNRGEKCAIVSGFNASGTIHIGHKVVFDTNLFFQKKFNVPVFIPISDDESYVAGKVKDQKEALKNSIELAKELLAYGFDAKRTYFIIDQIYTNIYNLAIKLSKKVTLSEIKASYGYENDDNPGLFFYPAVQSAHILLPQEEFGIKNVLVPIGPDEDTHIRICRDIAERAGYNKPAILHSRFLPGLDGEKMSKSKNNAIFLSDDEKTIRKKVSQAYSGGAITAEEHRKHGGKPEEDVSIFYLSNLFLEKKESERIIKEYKEGKLLSGEVKKMLADKLVDFVKDFQSKLKLISLNDLDKCMLKNKT